MVYAVSTKTTDAEAKYQSSRLELFAVICSLSRLRPYLLGIRFTVVTDCQSLVYLNIYKTVKPQILQEFDFEVKFRPGSRMAHVDALSRAAPPTLDTEDMSVEYELTERLDGFVAMTIVDKVWFMQQVDAASANLINLMKTTKTLTKHEKFLTEPYELHDGVLYRRHAGRSLLVVSRSMRKGIVIGAHDYGGHFSLDRTVAKITEDIRHTLNSTRHPQANGQVERANLDHCATAIHNDDRSSSMGRANSGAGETPQLRRK